MAVTLAEEIMLLSLDDESGTAKGRLMLAWPLGGALVLELSFAGRVAVADGLLQVVDTAPLGDELLDGRLAALAAWAEGRRKAKVGDWLMKDQRTSVRAVEESLCRRGLVTEENHRLLGVFPSRRYPEVDGSVEQEVRERLAAAVLRGEEADERTAALVAVLHAAGLHRAAFPGVPRKQVEPRMKELAEGQWVAESIRAAITAVYAAVTAGAVAAGVAASF
ncbi:Golgi phosphoprotein 3 GPP34 [Streptomyces sp. TLI_235]|nr:GPP34 family phosphoprotein [Streptomyces sp. TLI_235]PBC67516.1 Golgi phosphoprotein 3 GPP34 [Streptomyces sp. TLI_235]